MNCICHWSSALFEAEAKLECRYFRLSEWEKKNKFSLWGSWTPSGNPKDTNSSISMRSCEEATIVVDRQYQKWGSTFGPKINRWSYSHRISALIGCSVALDHVAAYDKTELSQINAAYLESSMMQFKAAYNETNLGNSLDWLRLSVILVFEGLWTTQSWRSYSSSVDHSPYLRTPLNLTILRNGRHLWC